MNAKKNKFLDKDLLIQSFYLSLQKFNPSFLIRKPVIFVTWVGTILSMLATIVEPTLFNIQISFWLFFTVFFANFSEAVAEGKGKAQADSLKKNKENIKSKKIDLKTRKEQIVDSFELQKNDIIICYANEVIPMDGEVIEGVASVDESAITGESAPVIRESGGDRSGVTGGTTVKSDWLIIKITSNRGETFVDRMIHLIEGAKRQKTPNEISLTLILSGLSLTLLCVVVGLKFFGEYSAKESGVKIVLSIPILVSLLICLIPTTIGGLLSAIGISGMNRLIKSNVIAKSGRAVEAAGDISVLLLDKTGTITYGNRMASELIPASDVELKDLAEAALLTSINDETPEGRSIVELCRKLYPIYQMPDLSEMNFIQFTAETRLSGIDLLEASKSPVIIRKGAVDAIIKFSQSNILTYPKDLKNHVQKISEKGGTPLLVARNNKILGVIYLKDTVKEGIKSKFSELRMLGIKTIMITGDNHLTAASIAAEAGVDDYIAEATPEQKLKKIREEQEKGNLVAMTGDGTNDAPALAQADVGVAMNSGTQAAKEAGNMVDLDSDPAKLIDIVKVGKQLLITRGALTTFSFANDIAKYFAILPAIFIGVYAGKESTQGPLATLNIMKLASPESAILSAVIFNALIIILLTPLALKGVKFSKLSTDELLLRNVLIYGVGGVITPFIGIKIIDILITFMQLA